MEKITRFIQKQRRPDFVQTFPYTTYDIIFDDVVKKDCPKLAVLFLYLEKVFLEGIPARDKSASRMPELMIKTKEHFGHAFCDLARDSKYKGQGNRQHEIVENYFMDKHPDCIATEFPLYNNEMTAFGDILLATEKPFSIKILDFKPNAKAEKMASTQIYYQRKILSQMTGICESSIKCFYFDDVSCYEVL